MMPVKQPISVHFGKGPEMRIQPRQIVRSGAAQRGVRH